MIEPIFFDTDCLSAFLWINNQNLLIQLYPDSIIIPEQVYIELSNPRIPQLKRRIDAMITNNTAQIATIELGTDEYKLYCKMINDPDAGNMIIGKGEAAAIALSKYRDGIVASNNLKDITAYISELNLKNLTTGDILKDALDKGLITETDGNMLWCNMLARRRRLGYISFTEFLKHLEELK